MPGSITSGIPNVSRISRSQDKVFRSISCERQPSLAAESVLSSRFRQLANVVCDARVLPNDRVRDRLASLSVPYDGGFALVGDSNRCQVSWPEASFRHGLRNYLTRVLPDFLRIVLNPSGLGVNLRVLFLRDRHGASRAVKHNETRARGALINCSDV